MSSRKKNLFKRTAALVAVPLLLGTAGCGKSLSDATITGRVKMAIILLAIVNLFRRRRVHT